MEGRKEPMKLSHHEPKPCMNPTVIGGLAEERRSFFRDIWSLSNTRD